MPNILSVPPLISTLFLFSLGIASLVSGRKELLWRTFAAFCFLLMASAATAFMISLSDDRTVILRHARFAPFFAILSLLFANYYAFILTRRSDPDYRSSVHLFGREIPIKTVFNVMAIVYVVLLIMLSTKRMVAVKAGELDPGHALFIHLVMTVFLLGMSKGIYFLHRAFRKSTDANLRHFLKLNIIAFLLIHIPVALFLFILPMFGLRTQAFVFFAFPIAVMVFYVAIIRYQFDQVDELNVSLEHRVEERTQELSKKNNDLEKALQQVKTVQSQLIMQEKLASLGNLVAGVAHEMNNPVGAINSSADTANRGLHKIKELLQNEDTFNPSAQKEDQIYRSLNLLEKSNQVIVAASERISKVVQSLKTFARLDEAHLQKVDVRENIDTTLTLMDHELKDKRSEERRVGKECRSRWSPYH